MKKKAILGCFLILGMVVVLGSAAGCAVQEKQAATPFSLGYVTIKENGIWEGRLRSEDGKEKVLFAFTASPNS